MRFTSHELLLDAASRRASIAGNALRLEPKTFDLLSYLLKNPRRVVRKQELLDALWWGEIVGESALTRSVSCLRKLLADDARAPRFIRTVHRCGYEFIAPVAVADAAAISDAARDPLPRRPERFVGRLEELARLRGALSVPSEKRQSAWLVRGESGIGKTRLLEEAVRAAAGAFEVHQVHGSRLEAAPLSLFRRCLRSLVRSRTLKGVASRFRGASSQTRRFLFEPGFSSAPVWSGAARRAELETLRVGLSALASARPLALVIDDLDAADAVSIELFALILDRAEAPVLLVGAYHDARTSDEPRAAALAGFRVACPNEIALRPLDRHEVAAFIEPWTGEVSLAEQLRLRTGGNPRFLSELASGGAEELAAMRLPAGIRSAVQERLAALPRETLDLLELASIPVPELTVPLLARASEQTPEQCARRLEPARVGQLLAYHERDRLSFAHGVVRETLYDELEPEQRCRAHLAVWSALAETLGDNNPTQRELLRASVRHMLAARACLREAAYEAQARDLPALLWSPAGVSALTAVVDTPRSA
jgi:DNA-binding winged helix-turn-helix (wHTH) protein